MPSKANRVLIAVPAYNEEASIAQVIATVRKHLAGFDLLIVNDGSSDRTEQILSDLRVTAATHLSNLGYGRAIQTAIKYALKCGYDVLITLDADGQHHPEEVNRIYAECMHTDYDVLIGSRFVEDRAYGHSPLGRKIGQRLFSLTVRLVAGQRVYDTTSGLKVIKRRVFEVLTYWHFVDFHAEAIIFLMRLGYRVGEYPVTVGERTHGVSMHSFLSSFKYPLKTLLMAFLGVVEASLVRRRKHP